MSFHYSVLNVQCRTKTCYKSISHRSTFQNCLQFGNPEQLSRGFTVKCPSAAFASQPSIYLVGPTGQAYLATIRMAYVVDMKAI